MKVGLYSVSYSGAWYPGPALSVEECIAKAKELGFHGVELGAKRPHANPMDLDEGARAQVREALAKHGVELAAVASYNDFTSPVVEHREMQLLMVREQIELARGLGAPVLRVFAAWPGVTLRDGLTTYDMTRRYVETQYPDTTWSNGAGFGRDWGRPRSSPRRPALPWPCKTTSPSSATATTCST